MTTLRPARRALAALALGAALLAGPPAQAQIRAINGLPRPSLLVVSPAGAKVGTTVEVTLSGLHLEQPEKLLFSNPAIKAELVTVPPPPVDPKTKQPPLRGRRGMAAGAPTTCKFKVTVPANVPAGHLDLRLVNKWGVSNPRVFVVGDLAEVMEKEPNNDADQSQRIDLNTTVNGAINNPTDVDYYVFSAKKGQRVLLSCLATSIDSRLQPALTVYDSKDRELAANRNYARDDALADFTAPEDGDYHVRVFQFAHTFRQPLPVPLPPGTQDYFYRLSVTTAPWIDAVYPPVLEPGKAATVTVYGRNLPGGKPDPAAVADEVTLEKLTVKITAPAEADARGKLR